MTQLTRGDVVEPGVEIVCVVELEAAPGRHEDLVETTRRNSERVVAGRVGCRSYNIDDPGPGRAITVLTRWDDEVAFRAHLQSALAAELITTFVGLLAAPMVPRVMQARRVPEA